MKRLRKRINLPKPVSDNKAGYPLYPPDEDVYSHFEQKKSVNTQGDEEELSNDTYFENDISRNRLDITGSELDDQQEDIGSEDEENNYYSIGGDRHDDLDENKM
jgi:hypothetical protein